MSSGQQQKPWDPWKMYDATPEELRAIRERGKMRSALKAEWIKKSTNPYNFTQGNHYIFDPQLQRFMSMKATRNSFFKGTFKSFMVFVYMVAVPVGLLTYFTNKQRNDRERRYRNGEVMYKDREYKFIY